MKPETKAKLLQIIGHARGDDLQRAQMAFRNLSPEQMQEQHGQSGRTRQEVLDGYVKFEAEMDKLVAEVEAA